MVTIQNLRNALGVAEQIERLQGELKQLLDGPENELSPVGRKITAHRRTNDLGKGLAPAVVSVLKKAGKPLRVKEILDGLLASGYKFTSKNPLSVLSSRIYSLKGVKKLGDGLFKAA